MPAAPAVPVDVPLEPSPLPFARPLIVGGGFARGLSARLRLAGAWSTLHVESRDAARLLGVAARAHRPDISVLVEPDDVQVGSAMVALRRWSAAPVLVVADHRGMRLAPEGALLLRYGEPYGPGVPGVVHEWLSQALVARAAARAAWSPSGAVPAALDLVFLEDLITAVLVAMRHARDGGEVAVRVGRALAGAQLAGLVAAEAKVRLGALPEGAAPARSRPMGTEAQEARLRSWGWRAQVGVTKGLLLTSLALQREGAA